MRYSLLAILMAFSIFSFAQSNYHAGYIIKNNGDTLKGYINYREWVQSPKTIDFKENNNDDKVSIFDPTTIKGFNINGSVTYVTYNGTISMDKNKFPNISAGLDTNTIISTVFLKRVASGSNVTLYSDADEIKTRFFIAESNSHPVELKYFEYYDGSQNQTEVVTSKKYIGQLLVYAYKYKPEDKKLINKIEDAQFNEFSLAKIADGLNSTKSIASNKNPSIRPFAGLTLFNTTNTVNYVTADNAPQDWNSVLPKVSVGIDIFDNPNVQRTIFRVEASYSYMHPKYLYHITFEDLPTTQDYSFTQHNFSITPQLIFNVYNKDDLKFYIDAGFSVNFSLYPNSQIIINSQASNNQDITNFNPNYRFAPLWLSIPLQAGVVLNKKVELFCTYQLNKTYSDDNVFYANNRGIGLGVHYLFGRHQK